MPKPIPIKIKRFDKTIPLPKYQTAGSAACDLAARKTVTIPAGEVAKVPLNVAIQVPATHWLLMAARSSLFKRGLMLANGIGVGDSDYCGDNDEYQAALYNRTDQPVTVEKGDRIAQMIVLEKPAVDWQEVETLGNKDRGGFGSTGRS